METILINLPNAILFILAAMYFLLLGFLLIWSYKDAELRGVNGWLITGLVFFSGTIAGVLAWLIFRPKPKPVPVRNMSRM